MSEAIGRKQEIKALLSYKDSREAELVVVYGRRRVGKTFLIRKTFDNQFAFYHTGLSPVETQDINLLQAQLKHFNESLRFHWEECEQDTPKDWEEAFSRLRKYLLTLPQQEKQVIFLDEFPWMSTPRSGFLTAFEAFWNGWASAQDNLYFIICGSATSWIVDNILANYGGLYGRTCHSIYLKPFTLKECEEYENARGAMRSRDEILRGYMILGGIPYYWKQLDPSLSLPQNIDNLFFAKNGLLRREFDALYASVFRNHTQYINVVSILSEKRIGFTRNEIIERLGTCSGGNITKILEDLENSGFIFSYKPLGEKDKVFMLADFYTWFYYKFIAEGKNIDPSFWTNIQNTPAINTWQGITFELVCMAHSYQIRQDLQIAGILCKEMLYRSHSAQIDLIIDRADRTVSVCEMKYCQTPYEMSADDDAKLRNRIADIQPYFGKTTSYKVTLVSPFGLRRGKNSGIVSSEVTLDGLFI